MTAVESVTTTDASRRRRTILGAVAVGAASLDVVTKLAAEELLDDGPTHIAGPLSFRLGHNSGVAFGLGATGPTWVVLTATAVVITVLAAAAWRGTFTSTLAVGLIFGGAVANFADRLGDGAVTDMIDIGWWPTFNVADIAITTGIALLVLTQHSPEPHPKATDSAADTSSSDKSDAH